MRRRTPDVRLYWQINNERLSVLLAGWVLRHPRDFSVRLRVFYTSCCASCSALYLFFFQKQISKNVKECDSTHKRIEVNFKASKSYAVSQVLIMKNFFISSFCVFLFSSPSFSSFYFNSIMKSPLKITRMCANFKNSVV